MIDKQDNAGRDSELNSCEPEKSNSISSTRRKLVIGTAPVLASLMSKSVWAEGYTIGRCTISGALSGPSSSHEDEMCQGLTPGYWKNHVWPAPYLPGTCVQQTGGQGLGQCEWQGDGTLFSAVFPKCAAAMETYGGTDAIDWFTVDMMTVLQMDKGGGEPTHVQFAFHVAAGLLNSADPGINYGYDAAGFIMLVEEFCDTGKVAGIAMTMEQFKDLLDARNNGDFNWFPV